MNSKQQHTPLKYSYPNKTNTIQIKSTHLHFTYIPNMLYTLTPSIFVILKCSLTVLKQQPLVPCSRLNCPETHGISITSTKSLCGTELQEIFQRRLIYGSKHPIKNNRQLLRVMNRTEQSKIFSVGRDLKRSLSPTA